LMVHDYVLLTSKVEEEANEMDCRRKGQLHAAGSRVFCGKSVATACWVTMLVY
jgi:hypothetical protein